MNHRHPLETARLRLEPISAGHVDLVYEEFSDESIWEFFPELRPKNREELRAMYARWERGNQNPDLKEDWENWIVFSRETGEPAGHMQAVIVPEDTAFMAFIFYRRHQGKGYARETAAAVIAHLASAHGVKKMRLEFDAQHAHAQKLAEALGFSLVEERRNVDRRYGLFGDEIIYERRL